MASGITLEPSYKLYVYYTRYSSWGVRVQLILEYFKIPYEVQYFNYTNPVLTPTNEMKTLPVLDVTFPSASTTTTGQEQNQEEGDPESLRIADSLAISEYLAEAHPHLPLWPADPTLRALARVAAAKMHSGFTALRAAYPSNFVAKFSGSGIERSEDVAWDVQQLFKLWENTRQAAKKRLAKIGEEDRGFLCGGFSIADAFFWPVLWRLRTYNVPLAGLTQEGVKWITTMWNDPVMKAQEREYFRQAADPLSAMKPYDDIFVDSPGITSGTFTEDWVFDVSGVSL
ncbi:putative glutathione S transferase [Xylaria arbuscula]|nr:putative glutathione S transferase [Xylaria arbuscula]